MKHAALVCVLVTLSLTPRAINAQGTTPGAQPPNYTQLVQQLNELAARVSKLEGNITAADLVGTYAVQLIGIAMDPPGTVATYNQMASYVVSGTATIDANGTGSLTGTAVGIIMTEQAPHLNWTNEGGGEPFATSLSWTFSNGVLSITNLSGVRDFDLNPAAGGAVLVSVAGGPPGNNQQLTVWTRR